MSKNFKFSAIGEAAANIWHKSYKWLFAFYLLAVILLGVYIWQKSTNGNAWSQEKKNQYASSIDKGVAFREDNFREMLDNIEKRKKRYKQDLPQTKNIFK